MAALRALSFMTEAVSQKCIPKGIVGKQLVCFPGNFPSEEESKRKHGGEKDPPLWPAAIFTLGELLSCLQYIL